MAAPRGYLDETVDAAVQDAHRMMTARIVTAFASAGLIGISLGWRTAILWLLVVFGCEGWTWIGVRPLFKTPALTSLERLSCLAAMAALTSAWSAIAVLYWFKHDDHLRMVAFCSIAGQLIHGQCYSTRSKAALVVSLSIPAAVLFFLVAFLGDYHGVALFVVTVSVLILIGYITSSALANMRQASDLVAARLEALDANEAKSSFLATMSHEIRTPLNGLLGMAQVMEADPLLPGQAQRLAVLRQSGENLLTILNDLLDLSKIEAGKVEIETIEFDLGDLVEGAKATFSALAAQKGLSFQLEMQTACGVYLGDPTRTRQILCNLISNAIKFTHTGQIDVEIRYNAGDLIFTISDQGIGMPQEVIEGLFTKFSQADKSTTRRFGGTGLGLAICKQLADLMAGDISVTSRPGQGSTFVFRAPYARIGAPRTLQATEPQSAETVKGGSIRVLAAEDNTINRLVLTTLLQQAGIDPLVVENGQLAVDAWDAGDWDVILMDIQMPVMDGMTAARTIRERELSRGRIRTPIIALTANGMSDQVARYLSCGMDGHVVKPIETVKLFEALEGALAQSHP